VNRSTEIVSSVPNVTVTKFDILSPQSVQLEIKYSGAGKAPAIKVESSAININTAFQDIANQKGAISDNSTIFNTSVSATSVITKLDLLGDILSSSNGTKAFDAGWKSPKSVTMKLKGNFE
jgi:hypothetical protein